MWHALALEKNRYIFITLYYWCDIKMQFIILLNVACTCSSKNGHIFITLYYWFDCSNFLVPFISQLFFILLLLYTILPWKTFLENLFWSIFPFHMQGKVSRTWIIYNKPEEPNAIHAGLLLALGLHGYLRVLVISDIYTYFTQVWPPFALFFFAL